MPYFLLSNYIFIYLFIKYVNMHMSVLHAVLPSIVPFSGTVLNFNTFCICIIQYILYLYYSIHFIFVLFNTFYICIIQYIDRNTAVIIHKGSTQQRLMESFYSVLFRQINCIETVLHWPCSFNIVLEKDHHVKLKDQNINKLVFFCRWSCIFCKQLQFQCNL